jgi:ribosomal protein L31E
MEEALEWLALIGGESEQAIIDNRRIVWMRAEGHRWRQICRAVGCVRSTAWRRWTAALVTIANRLNKQCKTGARTNSAKTTGDARAAKRGDEGAKGPP